jgi:hypothetical protein
MLRRFLMSAIAVVAVFFGGRAIVRALASPEKKIRWQLDSMAEGFNRTRNGAVLAGLAPDFLDETYGADRALVQAGLARIFFESKDPVTKAFPYRVELPREQCTITVATPDKKSAQVELLARFFEKHAGSEAVRWEVQITAELVLRDGDWLVRRSETKAVSGRMPR